MSPVDNQSAMTTEHEGSASPFEEIEDDFYLALEQPEQNQTDDLGAVITLLSHIQ